MGTRVLIDRWFAVTSAGEGLDVIWDAYVSQRTCLIRSPFYQNRWIGKIPEELTNTWKNLSAKYGDPAVALGVVCAQRLGKVPEDAGVIFGTSRGATHALEKSIRDFVIGKRIPTKTSPQTTQGAFASSVANAMGTQGIALSVSSACTTGLHALGLSVATIQSGFSKNMICGAADAAITPFTFSMLDAAGVQASSECVSYQPFGTNLSHGLVLGEGSAALLLRDATMQSSPEQNQIEIVGWGAGLENAGSTGVSKEGDALVYAIKQACNFAGLAPNDVDVVFAHGSGTEKGDAAEYAAYQSFFGKNLPPIMQTKWIIGHTLSASGLINVALACETLVRQTVLLPPYIQKGDSSLYDPIPKGKRQCLHTAMICGMGFGGNATVILIQRRP